MSWCGFAEKLVRSRDYTPMEQIELTTGTIDYEDAGTGPVLVLLPGLLMDASLWDGVIARLPQHRTIIPTLPLGAHRHPLRPDADLSPRGIAGLVGEFLERLELTDVTLAGNDTGGAIAQLLTDHPRVARTVLVSCEAFDNFPPGLTGRTIFATRRLSPTLFKLFMLQLRLKPVRRAPFAFGHLTKRGDATVARWRVTQPRDAVRMLRAFHAQRDFLRHARPTGPGLVVWAREDRVMPPEHGRRLAELLDAELVEIDDSYTLIPLDQPARLAEALSRAASPRPPERQSPPSAAPGSPR
jgi:pimeloyl-ACP methyl ester carboxylesterase